MLFNWDTPFEEECLNIGHILVHLPTKKAAQEFAKLIHKHGFHWSGAGSLNETTFWDDYGHNTVYELFGSKSVMYCSMSYYDEYDDYDDVQRFTFFGVSSIVAPSDFDIPEGMERVLLGAI